MSVDNYYKKIKIPRLLLSHCRNVAVFLKSTWHNRVLPWIFTWGNDYFPASDFHNIDIVPKKPLYDYYFFYDPCEKKYMDGLFSGVKMAQDDPHKLVSCPIFDHHGINRFLYPKMNLKIKV